LTVFDEEAHIGNSERIDDEEQIGTGDRIDTEDDSGPVSTWMTKRGSETSRIDDEQKTEINNMTSM
jgi:hypothetical protein